MVTFDTLDHEILMFKLEKYGFRGTDLEILRKYLSDRYQFVCENGNHSKNSVKTGVPQGSVLGPFLFLLYINDLQKVVKDSQIVMFADDTTIVKSGKHTDRELNEDLHRITDWFTASKLTVNIGKCEAISFGNGLPEKITILNEELCYKSSCKYLGLHLDGSLKFREHINYVVKKLNKFCGLIYRVRDLYPRKCLLMFYNSFARSIISYGILVYGSAAKTNLKKIENAQRRIIRAIFFKKRSESISNLLLENKILTVFELYIEELVKELFKQLRNETPQKIFPEKVAEKNKPTTRWSQKGLFSSTYCRTVVKRESQGNTLRKAFNWLKSMNLLPENIESFSKVQLRKYTKHLTDLYIVDNKHLYSIFF